MAVYHESKALIGRRAVCSYLRISKWVFYDLVKDGLPVTLRAGRWSGNCDELDAWFKAGDPQDQTPRSEVRPAGGTPQMGPIPTPSLRGALDGQ